MSEYSFLRNLNLFLSTYRIEDETSGLACTGNARKIVEEAQKFGLHGRILEVFAGVEDPEIDVSHSFVCLEEQGPMSYALNQPDLLADNLTAQQVRETGQDITETILNTPWTQLG